MGKNLQFELTTHISYKRCDDDDDDDDDVVLRHTLPVSAGLGRCPIANWDFAGAVSIFGPDALPVVHQWLLPGLEPATSRVRVAAHNH